MARSDRVPRIRMDADGRREAILNAARGLFAMQAYCDVSIAEISAAVGSSDALVYKYFDGKEGLYLEVLQGALDQLADRQTVALAELHERTPPHHKVATLVNAYLDHIAQARESWALPRRQPGAEPASAAIIRAESRQNQVTELRGLLRDNRSQRHEYALWGFWGFVDDAALRWVDRGAIPSERSSLTQSALGALQGALGDWAA